MLNEKEIFQLLKTALEEYIRMLDRESFSYAEYKAEAKAYMKVLNREDFKHDFLSKDRARIILDKIEKLNL